MAMFCGRQELMRFWSYPCVQCYSTDMRADVAAVHIRAQALQHVQTPQSCTK